MDMEPRGEDVGENSDSFLGLSMCDVLNAFSLKGVTQWASALLLPKHP